ncbi:MAG TPA: arginine deiminase family protein [Rhizomicrobium sp.]
MSIFDFGHALVRTPGESVVQGIRNDPDSVPDLAGLGREHAAYVAALRDTGLAVEILPPLEAYPDSVFVEDPALVFPEGAILTRPGAPARRGETAEIRAALAARFGQVLDLEGEGFVDGGDVLVTPDAVFIGLSGRTDRVGAQALSTQLHRLGRRSRVVAAPQGVLHLKSAAAMVGDDTVLATESVRASGIFADLRVLVVPESEAAAANALRIKDTVFIGTAYPRTADMVSAAGFHVHTLDVHETAKLDAGLSCMSLRW